MRLAILLGVVVSLGCSTLLDVERARELFRGAEEPNIPVLVEIHAAGLPAPEGLRAISGQLRSVPLKWDPLLTSDVCGYVIERAKEKEGPFQRIAAFPGRFENRYVDRGKDLAPKRGSQQGGGTDLGDGARYRYRVRVFDFSGRIGAASAPISATTAPPPAPPEGLHTYSLQPREVALSWRPSLDPTVAGYLVYRSTAKQGEYLLIARLEGPFSTTYVDLGLGALRVFYYRVASENGARGVGEATPTVRAVTKPEPLPPIGLRLEAQQLGSNLLAWDPNVEKDVAGYRLLRMREDSDSKEIVAALEPDASGAEDREIGAGERLSYAVVAFDGDGLESGPSDPIEVESVGYGLRAEAQEGAIHLHWSPEVQEGFAAARVLRERTFGSDEIARVPEEGFVDREVKPGRRYRYLVILVREDGSEAPPSKVVEAIAPE
jgi:fibronectin type 3 domain-containing protein